MPPMSDLSSDNMYVSVNWFIDSPNISKVLIFGCTRHVMFAAQEQYYHLMSKVKFSSLIYFHVDKAIFSIPYVQMLAGVVKIKELVLRMSAPFLITSRVSRYLVVLMYILW